MSTEKEEEEEKKKWMIERVQTLVKSYIEKIEAERARNRAYTDKVENGLKTWRNAILGTVAFFAPIILAFYSDEVSNGSIPAMFYVDIIIGLIAFLGFTFVMGRAHRLILELDGYYYLASDILADLNSLIIKETTEHIHEIEAEKIKFYWSYLAFASLAVRVYLIDIFDDLSKSIIFRRDRGRWKRYRLQQKDSVVQAMDTYYANPRSFLAVNRANGKYITDIVRLNPSIEEFFNYNPNGKRALVVKPIDLDKLEKEINDKAKTIKPN